MQYTKSDPVSTVSIVSIADPVSIALAGVFIVFVTCACSEQSEVGPGVAHIPPKVANSELVNERTAAFLGGLRKAMESKEVTGDLSSFAPFGWDKACLVEPYGLWIHEAIRGEKFKTVDDVRWIFDAIPWIGDERDWTLLLVAGHELTPVRIQRSEFEYRHTNDECVKRGEAIYKIDLQDGKRVISIRDKEPN